MARDIGSVFGNQILVLGCGLISGVLTARLLGPPGKGTLVVGTLVAGLTASIAHLGLPWAVTYKVARIRDEPSIISETIKVCLRLLPLSLSLIGAIYLLTFGLWRHSIWRGVDGRIVAVSASLCVGTLLLTFLTSLLGGVHNFRARNAIALTAPVLVAVGVLWLWLSHSTVTPLLLLELNASSVAASVLGGGCYVLLVYRPTWSVPVRPTWRREYVGYGLQFQLALIAQSLNYRLDSLLINALIGNAMLGLYSVAVTVAEILLRVPEAINFVLYPRVSADWKGGRDRVTALTLGTALYIVTGCCVVLATVAGWLVPRVFGRAFAASVPATYLLLPGMVAQTVVRIICHVAAGFGRPVYATYITAIGLCVTVPLDLLLVPRYGIIGAATASSIAYTVSAVAAVRLYSRFGAESQRNVFVRSLEMPVRWIRERYFDKIQTS